MSSKRLAIYLVCAFVIYCAVRLAGSIKAARERERFRNNEQQVKTYIASIRPRWETFRQTNAGLECIKIESTYHEDGSVAVYGPVTSQVQIVQVVNFFRDTHPP